MAASIRTYNPDLSRRLAQRLETPEHLTPDVLARLALKALFLLQQEQAALPVDSREQFWYVEGTVAFPQMRVAWDCAWVERDDGELVDVVRAGLEETACVYFPAAQYIVTTPLDLAEIEHQRLPLVREDPDHPGTYPKYYYQQAHQWALVRALAATDDQYYQARAASPLAFSEKLLIEALMTQHPRLLSFLLALHAPLIETFRACPDWVGHDFSWARDAVSVHHSI